MKRAYASEPILFDTSPIKQPLPGEQKNRRRYPSKRIAYALVCAVIVLGAIGIYTVMSQPVPIIPEHIQRVASFPLVAPKSLPKGMHLDNTSFRGSSSVITFAIIYDTDKRLVFSEQLLPARFDFASFYEQLDNRYTIQNSISKATIGELDGATVVSVITDTTWVLIRAEEDIQSSSLEDVVRSLRVH